MGNITVQVTPEHIQSGIPKDPRRCPVALAIRAVGLADPVVGSDLVFIGSDREAELPAKVQAFVFAYDHGIILPEDAENGFSFELTVTERIAL